MLFSLGADLNDTPPPLGAACWGTGQAEQNTRIIDVLVSAGADLGARDDAGWSLLHRATMPYSHGAGFASSDGVNLPAVEALLRHGTSPDPLGPGDVTPLMLAAGDADVDCVRSLLAAEADPTRLDRQARTAADHAGQTERLMAELLPGAPGDVDEAYIRRLLDARRCAELLAKPPRRRRR